MATYTELAFDDAARTALLAGTAALADAVRPTLGPQSRAVLIERKWGVPLVCDDGVTIAKTLKLKDHAQDLVVVERIRGGSGFERFDASAREFVDLDEASIIDPTKIVRTALENAVSVAGVMLLAEATMVELDEPESPEPADHGLM